MSYTIRPAHMEEVQAVIDLLNFCSRQEIGEEEFSVSEWAADWASESYDVERDTRVVLSDTGEIVGYADVFDITPHERLTAVLRVHPDHWGQGLEDQLMHWLEERSQLTIPKAPEGARVTTRTHFYDSITHLRTLFEAHGYQHIRNYLQMLIELNNQPPQPQWSEGITVRTAVPKVDDRAIYDAYIDSFSDHWGFVVRPFEVVMDMFTSPEDMYDPSLWFLAMDGDKVVGTCLGQYNLPEDPHKGWVNIVGVIRSHRNRGIALALLHHAFGEYYRRGFTKVALGVDADSLTGATRLYEKAGMSAIRSLCAYEKVVRDGVEIATQTLG